jgi:hypothetical protein
LPSAVPSDDATCVHKPKPAHPVTKKISRDQGDAAESDQQAINLISIVRDIRRSGEGSLWKIAEALNARNIRGVRGGKWYATTVRKLLERS